jgi:predicted RNA binding protein with dsRBD fold (UPF0201 family)
MEQVTIRLEADVHPTESEDQVKAAVTNIVGGANVTIQSEGHRCILTAEAQGQDSLIKLRSILRSDRIRDASRKALFRSTRGNTINFCLNKQVAFVGHVSFCEETAESPLGPIHVTIAADNPQQLVEWLAEKTNR